uniref:G protein-coupled receptor n=1 Tax=Panagrellus redivivus TaxID=6233 RepID=A0A7E5A0T0_PANRE
MMLVLIVYAFAIQFYFRYKTLCCNVKVSFRLQLILWSCAILFSLAIAVAFMFVYEFHNDLKTYNPEAYDVAAYYFDPDSRIPFVVAPTNSPFLASIFGIGGPTLLLSLGLSIHYGRRISEFVNHSASMTHRFKNVYITFHRSLKIQAITFYISAIVPLILPRRHCHLAVLVHVFGGYICTDAFM